MTFLLLKRFAKFKRWVELNEGFRQKIALLNASFSLFLYAYNPDTCEAVEVFFVILDNRFMHFECLHQFGKG